MFGQNVEGSVLLAPAETMIEESTSDATCEDYMLEETGASFTSTIEVGDLVIKAPGEAGEVSAYVVAVISDTKVQLDRNLSFDESVYSVLRPSMSVYRPGREIEWSIHTINFPKGNIVNRVGVYSGDGNREGLIEDFETYWRRRGVASEDMAGLPPGFVLTGQNLKVDYNQWLILKSYVGANVFVTLQGINKTMSAS